MVMDGALVLEVQYFTKTAIGMMNELKHHLLKASCAS